MGVEPHPVPSCTTRRSFLGDGSVLGSLSHAPTRAGGSGRGKVRVGSVGYVRPFQDGGDACTYLANFEVVVGPFRRVVAEGDGGTRTRTREAVQHGARIPLPDRSIDRSIYHRSAVPFPGRWIRSPGLVGSSGMGGWVRSRSASPSPPSGRSGRETGVGWGANPPPSRDPNPPYPS